MKENEKTLFNVPVRTVTVESDPQDMLDVASVFVNRQLHRGLMSFTSEMQLVNDLAESFETKNDGKTFVFKLRELQFSDGSPISAEDVVKTFRRIVKISSAIAADLQCIIGFSREDVANKVAIGIKSLSKNEVEFQLHFADPFFIKNLAAVDCSILKLNSDLELTDATSGRFRLSKGDRELILIPTSQLHAADQLRICKLILAENNEQAVQLAKKGLIDTLESYEISDEDSQSLRELGWKEDQTSAARTLFLSVNPRRLVFEERKSIFANILSQNGSGLPKSILPGFGLIPSALGGALAYEDIADLVAARDVVGKKPTSVRISHPEGTLFEEVARWVQRILSEMKINVSLESFPFKDYFKRVEAHDYDIILRSKFLDYPDGMSLLTYFKSGEKINTFDAGDAASDALITQAQAELDDLKRTRLYKDAQLKLLSNHTLVPISNATISKYLVSPRVLSIKAHPMGRHSLQLHEVITAAE